PFENPPGIDAGLTVGIGNAERVAHQTPGRDGLAHLIDRGNRMLGRQLNKSLPVRVRERAATDEQRASPALHERCKGGLEVALALDVENDDLLPDCLRRHLQGVPPRCQECPGRRAWQSWPRWVLAGAAGPIASSPPRWRESSRR